MESATSCGAWAVASTGGSVMALPAGTTDYRFTTIASVSISADGKTLSASFSALPLSDNAPMELVQILSVNKELRFTGEGLPDLTGMTPVDSLDTDANLHRVYMGNGWAYNCYPNDKDNRNQNIVQILDQSGKEINFKDLSPAPISCTVQATNATVTDADFGQTGALVLTSGKITGGTYHNANVGINSTNRKGTVEITGGTFDFLYCNSSCSIANAVIQSCGFNTYDNNTYTISDTVLGELPDGIQNLLPAGQQLSTLVVRNGGVTAMNGRTLPLSTNTIYLVGAGSAELTLNTDVLSINDAPVENYNANTSANGKVLRITGKNDGAEIFVNKSTDPSDLKPLRITEKGLPDLTGVTGVPVSGGGMTANLYEGLGWKYATMKENGRTRAALYITTPDGNPVDLASGAINPYHKAIAVEQITFANVTVTGIEADSSVNMQNATVESGTFQKDVYADDNSTIAGGTFQDVVRAYGTITGGAFNAVVQLNQNSEVTGGVFHDIQLPSYATEKTVIQNAMILGSLKTDGDSKAAVSNTVSCGYIESKYLAAGQQQSKLMMTDGTVERLNDYAAATDAVYLIGNVKAEIRFSNAVTNINGAEASNYNEGTSAIDRSLTITAKNDGEPIVVNMATTGKLPFSSLSKSDFDIDWSTLVPGITCKKEGVGKPSVVFVRTYDKKEFDHFPSQDEYGSYKVYIRAEEGTLYEGGELQIDEATRPYKPTSADFRLDLDAGTATYTGRKYFGDAVPQAVLKYSATNDFSTATETVPTKVGTYYVWLVVEGSRYYDGSNDQLPDGYTVAEKLPFESLKKNDFKVNVDNDGNYTVTCPDVEGVGELSTKLECLTGVNKGKTFINRNPDEDLYGRYQGSIVAEEGKKYKAGSIVVGEDSIPYAPKAADFTYDAATNKVKYTGTNYYDADPDMTRLYGPDRSETVPTAPGSYDVYVRVTSDDNYMAVTTEKVGTYVVPEPTKPKYYYYWNAQEGKEHNEGDKITLSADKREGYTITWKVEGLAEDAYTITDTGTHIEIQFTMPANDVHLKSVYEPISYTLTVDGKDELRDFDENVTVTAPEKVGETFTGWEVDGVPEGTDTTKATISFKMPANKVTLTPQYEKNTYTLTLDGVDEQHVAGDDINFIASDKEGYTFSYWKAEGVPEGTDTTKANIRFTMPANNVTLEAQYKQNTYTLTVDGKDEQRDFEENVTVTAQPVEGKTFTGWEVTGLPADVDTTKATISFTMPANNVTLKAQYTENAPETYELKVTDAKVTLKDGGAVADLTAVPVGTELKATADEDTETSVFKNWNCTGLELTEEQRTAHEIYFTMPDHDVNLKAVFVTPTNKLDVSGAQVTLKDGGAVADLTAVPVDTELKVIADEDTETSVFKSWSCTGLELTEEQSTAREMYFTMPDHDVNLVAEFVTPTKPEPKTYELHVSYAKVTLKDGGAVADLKAVPVGTELKVTADEDTETSVFKNWSCTGLELTEEQRTAREMYFTMPDHDVNLVAEFVTPTKPEPKTYELHVSYAKVTLKDGGTVADLTAVPVGTELVATADEDTETSVFKSWSCTGLELTEEQRTACVVEFTMPDHDVELTAVFKVPATPDPDPTPAPGGDGGGAAIVAVAAVGGAAIGVGAYIAGTTAYLKSVLPEGMAIPANRQQLAVALWTAAGKPATQSTALFNDVAADAAELQAIRWVVETGLMTAQDGNFKPGSRVGRLEVIRTWKTYQQRG